VIDAAASVAEQVLGAAPGIHILGTSREPLRASGEHVHRLIPLGVPVSSRISASEALTFSAIQLFVERATANSDEFSLSDEHASNIADICRRLDGIPLAMSLRPDASTHSELPGLRRVWMIDSIFSHEAGAPPCRANRP
jgi:predicted ATPase